MSVKGRRECTSRSIRVFHHGMFESRLLLARQQVVQVKEVVNFAKVKRSRASSPASFYRFGRMTCVQDI